MIWRTRSGARGSYVEIRRAAFVPDADFFFGALACAESRYDTSLAGGRSAFHAVGAFVTSAATGLTRHISARHRGPPEQWLW